MKIDRKTEQRVGGDKKRRQSGEERSIVSLMLSHITAASHESLGIMEELEHTCPHPRTVGSLCVALLLAVFFLLLFLQCVYVCETGSGGETKEPGFSSVMKQIICSMWLLEML